MMRRASEASVPLARGVIGETNRSSSRRCIRDLPVTETLPPSTSVDVIRKRPAGPGQAAPVTREVTVIVTWRTCP